MKTIRSLIVWAVLAIVVISCEIVENDPAPGRDPGNPGNGGAEVVDRGSQTFPSDSTEIAALLHGNSSKIWSSNQFTIAGLSLFQNCRLDDQVELISDGTYSYDGGTQLCGAEDDSRVRTGTWEIDPSLPGIIFDRGTELESTGNIITLEAGLIVLSGTYQNDLFGSFAVEGRYVSDL